MKKVLLATTALVASAGIASADVDTTGSAEMGVAGGSGMQTQFHQDIEVKFTMSGETDNGLSFGASVELDEGGTAGAGTVTSDDQGYSVFIKGDFGTLTMGDTDGGFDWAMAEVALAGGSINDAHTGHAGWNGNGGLDGNYDGQVVSYSHSVGDFSFAVSVEADDSAPVGDPIFGLGVKYNADLGGTALGIGFGYQTGGPNSTDEALGISLGATMDNGIALGLNYSQVSEGTGATLSEYTHVGIGIGYTMDALAIGLNYGQYDYTAASIAANAAISNDADGFGLAVQYDLGGGAKVQFGYGSGTPASGAGSTDSWSLGVAMSF